MSVFSVALAVIFIFPFSWSLYRYTQDFVQRGMFTFLTFLLEKLLGTKFRSSGDNTKIGEKALIIVNHRSRLDWLFLWSWFHREGRIVNQKIVMKESMKHLVPFGWSIQSACTLLLKRDWNLDSKTIENAITHFGNKKYPIQILLFPEGTDKTPQTTQKSREFSQKNGLRELNHLIHPRTSGFFHFLDLARKHKLVDVVYDLTLSYQSFIPQNEKFFFTGFPEECHVHLKKFDVDELPTDRLEVEQWLQQRWYHKDVLLENFYNKDRKFVQEPGQPKVHQQLKPESVAQRQLYLTGLIQCVQEIHFLTTAFHLPSEFRIFFLLLLILSLRSLFSRFHVKLPSCLTDVV
eukprot:TRINITY_DN4463_c0_g1_i10.p1 TRINITY_DN4463_c0_g1~~TRINITY_DN4463_c0_g1_i10.p1  ORF type:complete len:407 (+),score=57.82 TRINITY_DN4463_c0_g1_i10:180-1223(+)